MTTKRTLAQQLDGPLPAGIDALPDDQQQVLADALSQARRAQAEALQSAGESALSHIPFFIRPAVRKAVGL
ncbi:hypothetical protein [Prauserella rugosa]|uniref:Uncharacterized protein n=1 Tax=Prauserella rugosa TaxID=43354 RepID=A0A660CGP9_9PSEU|nr:hypothetical protein [Prauserella rugosa]KMS87650.1 hypothetical protein ACZ91_30145 [Streptomyces regensis]TWH22650.1 hypothetical protein JD82_04539 [Prauserella rugosa]